jgi:tetratricopeptide (TPR) repeat protein
LGWGYYFDRELDKALECVEKGLEIQRSMALTVQLSMFYLCLAMVYSDLGDLEKARTCTGEALQAAQSSNEKSLEGLSTVFLGIVLRTMDTSQSNEVEKLILEGIRLLEDRKVKPLAFIGYFYLGELYADTSQTEKALEALKAAEVEFKDMGMDYWLRRTQEALARIQS